jgi:hypothetical protein
MYVGNNGFRNAKLPATFKTMVKYKKMARILLIFQKKYPKSNSCTKGTFLFYFKAAGRHSIAT